MVGGMMLTSGWNFHLPALSAQAMVLLFCQTFPVLLVLLSYAGSWALALPDFTNQNRLRGFWLGLMTHLA